jgi:tight adherence protein C
VILFLGLFSIAGALGLGVYLLVGTRKAQPVMADGMFGLGAELPHVDVRSERNSDPTEVPPLFKRMQNIAAKLSPSDYAERLQRKLDLAGNPRTMPAERVLAYKGFGLVAGVLIGALFGIKHGGIAVIAIPAIAGAFGLFLPDVLIKNMGQHRQQEVQKGLPDAMDMLTLCVEAGLGFDAALARVARNQQGPMAEECTRVLQEMQVGKSRAQALRSLSERTDVVELRSFVSAIIQSSELGISIGSVLREQAKEMRLKRRQRAEEKAQKLQVKILLPLISCLLPAIFIVVLGPAVIHIVGFFGQVNN